MPPVPSDTAPSMARRQIDLLREAGPARRAGLATALSDEVVARSRAALRRAMPNATPQERDLRWVELNYGVDIARALRAYLGAAPP